MKKSFAEKAIEFNKNLKYTGELPQGFEVLNPFKDNPETVSVMEQFYNKFYNDNNKRKFIIGINPGRHGAGTTGVPFTDTKRLRSICGIEMTTAYTHEVSSVFVYEMIEQYGGVNKFYKDFYINSPFPLAIIRQNNNNKWVNANYYDESYLFNMTKPFMLSILKKELELGLKNEEVFVLGKKNADFIKKMNKEVKLFDTITVLEHPRYIQQYKSKEKQLYIDKYLKAFYQ